MSIEVHVERLVLDGLALAPAERAALGAGFEHELGALLERHGLGGGLASGATVPSLPGGVVALAPNGGHAALGQRIAAAVHGGLSA
jgi:hypothetical protein